MAANTYHLLEGGMGWVWEGQSALPMGKFQRNHNATNTWKNKDWKDASVVALLWGKHTALVFHYCTVPSAFEWGEKAQLFQPKRGAFDEAIQSAL